MEPRNTAMGRVLSVVTATAILGSMMMVLLTGCNRVPEGYVPEGYVPEGYVPVGYISIEDARELFSALVLPAGYLDGTSEMISNQQGREISEAVQAMESSFVAEDEPVVRQRDWSIYTSQLAKAGLTFDESVFYDRLDELCQRYINSAALDGVKSSARYKMDGAQYNDLNLDGERAADLAFWFRYNNPQYYFLSNSLTYSDEKVFFFLYDFASDGGARVEITNKLFDKLDSWIESVNSEATTTWQKELYANNLLCKKIFYNDDYVTNKDPLGQTLYSAVMLEGTVCAGYAEAFSAMMNASGVDTAVVLSPTHAWNVVNFDDGNCYAIDVTWNDNKYDDDNPKNRYFNVGDKTLKMGDGGAHTYSDKYISWAPELQQIDYVSSDYDKTGVGANTNKVQLGTPKNLRVSSDEDGKLHFTWDAVDGADGYTVEVYDDGQENKLTDSLIKGTGAALTYGSRTAVSIRVRAESGDTSSLWSDFLSVKTKASSASGASLSDANKLSAPKNVKITVDEARRTLFSWDEVDGAEQYQTMLFRDASHQETWVSSIRTEASGGYKSLDPDTTYYYGVRAMKTVDGESVYSDWTYFSHKTKSEAATSTASTKPAAPANVKVTETAEENKSRISWNEVSGATGYEVCIYKDSSCSEIKKSVSVSGKTYCSLNNVSAGTVYYIGVRAVKTVNDQDVYSDWTNVTYTAAGTSKPAAPQNFSASVPKEGSADFTWNAVSGATEYEFHICKDSTYSEVWVETTIQSNKVSFSNLVLNYTYYIEIRAVKTSNGDKIYSDWSQFTYKHTVG